MNASLMLVERILSYSKLKKKELTMTELNLSDIAAKESAKIDSAFVFYKPKDGPLLDIPDMDVKITVASDSTVTQMCYAFNSFLLACGYQLPDEHVIGVVHECEV